MMKRTRSLPGIATHAGFGVYAGIGDGRRVASSGEAGGHLFLIGVAGKPESEFKHPGNL